jgi:hypothetical protein
MTSSGVLHRGWVVASTKQRGDLWSAAGESVMGNPDTATRVGDLESRPGRKSLSKGGSKATGTSLTPLEVTGLGSMATV